MKTRFLFPLMLAFAGVAMAQAETVKGNGKMVTKTVQVKEFDSVSLSPTFQRDKAEIHIKDNFPFTFNYKQSPAGQLTVTTDENVFPHLRFDVSNGDLQILAEEGDKVYPTRLEVKGSSAELSEVNLAGKVDFTLTGDLRGEDLNINVAGGGSFVADGAVSIDDAELNVAGGGTLRLAQLSGKSVEANAAGGGEMTLKGTTEDGKYNVAGGGKIQADELKAEDVDANVAAGGKIYVYASSSLKAASVAGGRIYYKGNPDDVDKSSVLGGGIRKMDE